MKVFILLSVIAVAFASRQCGENEHYNSCGTACPLTCGNYKDAPLICNKMCNPGCHCDNGYVRSDDGRCVRPEECPIRAEQCGENQHYESCGTACPLTCEKYANPPLACILMCNPGCHCDEGYVKTQDGRCVRPEECPANAEPPVKSCLGKPDPGMCRGYFPAWYYDVQTGKCHQFIYGGCQGNGNRYTSEEECLYHCGDLRPRESSANLCELEIETGPCRAYIPRYHFDKKIGQCKRFIYGGCGGNENNFETAEACHQACGARQEASTEQCELPAVTGPCRGRFPRFYFDKQTGQCQSFIFGGCGGNENNFETEDVCNQVCGARKAAAVGLCQLPVVTGPCRGFFHRFYFDQSTGKCEKFVYGGCRGNENNFETEEACKQICA